MIGTKKITTLAAMAVASTEASIFWEKLSNYFGDLSLQHLEEVLAW